MTELYAALLPVLDEHDSHHGLQAEEEGQERPVQLAIMGLPNVVGTNTCIIPVSCLVISTALQLHAHRGVVRRCSNANLLLRCPTATQTLGLSHLSSQVQITLAGLQCNLSSFGVEVLWG